MSKKHIPLGGEFLIIKTDAEKVFIPEEYDEEQLMIKQTCQDFLDTEVFPYLDKIDEQEDGLMRSIHNKAGEYGLLGISIPEKYEGFGQSFVTSMLAGEVLGAGYSFAVAYSCHTGIGTLPILYYGTEEQKAKYIPKLATGEWAGCYCLTEPGAGSDANSGKTKAVLSDDGKHYILNGQKMWITNGGFAEIQTVFAKIENDRVLSAFIVEKDWEGVVIYPEEKKMGIKGSSTVQIFYNDVKVPAENLLGRRGGGFRIALNILHMGRLKLGGSILGSAKLAIKNAVNYANERKQFGSYISQFGAIKYKLAEMVIKTFTAESAVYRSTSDVDDATKMYEDEGKQKGLAVMEAFNRFAIEAAALKVYGSESLDYVVDEMVQIFGGMGFSAEAPSDRSYRDSRINRIFEGTNEINRILVVDTTLKRAKRGLHLFEAAEVVIKNLGQKIEIPKGNYFEKVKYYIENFKKITLLLIYATDKALGGKIMSEQEILLNISDIIMKTYVAESTALRIEKLEIIGTDKNIDILKNIQNIF